MQTLYHKTFKFYSFISKINYKLLKKKPITYIIQKEKRKQKNTNLLGGSKVAMREKNIWILVLFLLGGIVVGGLLGELASHVDFLSWLAYGQDFGLSTPIELDLNVIKLTFGLVFKINISSIIGIILAIFIYKKI